MACALAASAQVAPVDVSSTTRLEAVQAAMRARDPRAAAGMAASFAGEPVPAIRAALVRGVAALDPVRGAVLARSAMSDPQPIVRLAGAEALAQDQGSAAAADLAAALAQEPNAGVRHAIADALGALKSPASTAALVQALAADPDPNVRLQAALSLRRHGGAAALRAVKNAKSDADPRVRAIANEP